MAAPLIKVVGVSRPYPGEDVSGDAWLHLKYAWGDRIILVDGAGHGPTAAAAAQAALETLQHPGQHSFDDAFRRCHEALFHTRGAVLSMVEIAQHSLSFAGVGNVDGRLIQEGRVTRFTPDRGLLGSTLPRIHPLTLDLPAEEWFVVMHSDGVSLKLNLEWHVLREPQSRPAALDGALEQWGRMTDDAMIVLISPSKETG